MAGEWIKLETNLPTKPEVFKLARLINENVDTTVGLLCRFWCWADAVTVDGVVDAVVDADVDAVVKHSGFCASLIESGWLKRRPGEEGFVIPNFERHNGESAKKRALKSERQARWRAKSVDVSETQQRLHERLPEKRREEVKEGAFGSVIFTECLDYLISCGQSEKQARAFLGMLLRDWDETVVAAAVRSSVGKADPLAYARKILSAQPKKPKAPEGSHAVLAKLREKYPNVRLASDGRAFFDPATQNRFSLTGERLASA